MNGLGIPGVDSRLPSRGGHLWRGDVVRVEGSQAWLQVPDLFGDNAAGPYDVLDLGSVELAAGSRVLVAAVGGDQDDLVVVGKLR